MALEDKNKFKVALTVNDQVIISYYRGTDMAPDEALNLAAWLSGISIAAGGDFNKYIKLCTDVYTSELLRRSKHGKPK